MRGFSMTSPRPFMISIGSPTARLSSIGMCSRRRSRESNGKTQTVSSNPRESQGERQMPQRHFNKSRLTCLLISGLALSSAASAVTLTDESKLDKAQAGYFRFKVGSVDVTALSDGTLGWEPIEQLTNVKPGEAAKLLDKAYVKSPVEASMNAFLIQLGDRLILVDAGTGGLLGPKLFKLPSSLKNAGYSPEQITDILVTHVHPDHTGGLTVGGKRVFPNAIVHMDKRELAYWTDKSAEEKAPEPTKSIFKT